MKEDKALEIAQAHWKYIEELLITYGIEENTVAKMHYISAFVHGWKHGIEEVE